MKTKINLPPDFGEFYVNNFGVGVGYANSNILISNFIQISDIFYISFCECYWDNIMYILILEYDIMQAGELLKFKGHKAFKELLMENYFFKNKGIVSSDFIDSPLEEFYDSPIEVTVESLPGNETFFIGNKPYRKFNVTGFSFPKVLDLKKFNKKK